MSGSIASGVKSISVEKESAWYFGSMYFESFMLKMRTVDQAMMLEMYQEAYDLLKQEYMKLHGFVKINTKASEICQQLDQLQPVLEQQLQEYGNFKLRWVLPSAQHLKKLSRLKYESKQGLDKYYSLFMQLFTELGMFMPTQQKDTRTGIEKFQDKYIDRGIDG